MNPLIPIIAQYGLQFTIELLKMIEEKKGAAITSADLLGLKEKYATKTSDGYLQEAEAAIKVLTPSGV